MRRKRAVIHEINRVVDWVNQVAIKTQAFLSFYVLHTFEGRAKKYLAFRMRQQVGYEVRTQHGNKINNK
jgi:hypothetical protein